MRKLFLECATGVSGDMLLASLSHALEELKGAGKGFDFLKKELQRLNLKGFTLEWSEKKISGIGTHHVEVVQTADQPMRRYTDLVGIINESGIPDPVAERVQKALKRLGQAEAKVHGVDLDHVHFHEIGAVDTLVDICGTMVLLHALEVENITISPVDLGSGFVHCAHGVLPVPAPACAELAKGLVTFGSDCGMERATPTGLAILRTIADDFGFQPLGKVESVGYGSGTRSSDAQPTYVRAFVLESVDVQH